MDLHGDVPSPPDGVGLKGSLSSSPKTWQCSDVSHSFGLAQCVVKLRKDLGLLFWVQCSEMNCGQLHGEGSVETK